MNSKQDDKSNLAKELLWLYVPDFTDSGFIQNIDIIPSSEFYSGWIEHSSCAGKEVDNKHCTFWTREMELVSYQPEICIDGTVEDCSELVIYAWFNVKW